MLQCPIEPNITYFVRNDNERERGGGGRGQRAETETEECRAKERDYPAMLRWTKGEKKLGGFAMCY